MCQAFIKTHTTYAHQDTGPSPSIHQVVRLGSYLSPELKTYIFIDDRLGAGGDKPIEGVRYYALYFTPEHICVAVYSVFDAILRSGTI